MSLFGKILAFLNILGAAALVYTGAMSYSKRQAGAYSVFLCELVLNGLPLDEEERTAKGQVVADLIGEKMQKELFPPTAGGSPVTTQKAEMEALSQQLRGKAESLTDPRERMRFQARVLLPLTDDALEREWLLACRAHLATSEALAQLKKRHVDTFPQAFRPGGELEQPLFRKLLRSQGGEPGGAFTSSFLRALPARPGKAPDDEAERAPFEAAMREVAAKAFDQAVEDQRAWLGQRFDQALQEAEPAAATQDGKPAQRRASARLLVRLSAVRAEEEVQGPAGRPEDKKLLKDLAPGSAEYEENLTKTAAYKKWLLRAQVVTGQRATLEAVGERARALQQIDRDLARVAVEERGEFVADHQALVDQAKERAAQLDADVALLARQQELLRRQRVVVNDRREDVEKYEMQLAEARKETAKVFASLQKRSNQLLALRLKLRDVQQNNEKRVQDMRRLEDLIRELEADRSPGRR
jgi:hypothetical protein